MLSEGYFEPPPKKNGVRGGGSGLEEWEGEGRREGGGRGERGVGGVVGWWEGW